MGECHDMELCYHYCTDAFACSAGTLVYGGGMTLGTCQDCHLCEELNGDCGCYDVELCARWCASR